MSFIVKSVSHGFRVYSTYYVVKFLKRIMITTDVYFGYFFGFVGVRDGVGKFGWFDAD